ncbi:hypothetical protein J4219_06680 [Candidatus Woesearchaeota archaeon]|nr:hypothetical protein [Candidatus Woesearchaeota archaeon]
MKEAFKATILEFLLKKNCIGGVHTPLGRVKSCIELHSKPDKKEFEQALDELVKETWVISATKRTGKGTDIHLSLNPRTLGQISEFLRTH